MKVMPHWQCRQKLRALLAWSCWHLPTQADAFDNEPGFLGHGLVAFGPSKQIV